jgi:hypothetical protein
MEAPPLKTDVRKQAEVGRQMAGKEDKAFWLRLAEDWAKLSHDADVKPKRDGRQRH